MPPQSILILGLGELATSILTSLIPLKPTTTTLTVLIRPTTFTSPSPLKSHQLTSLSSLGVTFLPADILTLTPKDLTTLFTPYTLIISALGFASPSSALQTKITRAVLAAKVPRYIPWQFGVDYDIIGRGSGQPVWDEQLDVRDLLRAEGHETKWTIISTGLFTSFLFEPSFGIVGVEGGKIVVRALGGWENRVTVTSPGDIGRITAEVVLGEWEEGSRILFTAGDTVSYSRLAQALEEKLGVEVGRVLWDVEFLERELRDDPDDNMKRYRVAFAKGRGVSWDKERSFNVEKGLEVVDVEDFVERNMERIRQGEELSEKWK
ncbi:NAD(P)-binding Rossmann-fold containing protein [Glarea lozoyensis ATCC 20868]|uniref:NAD(P)-binding Rossmann-fold containing protein n=1 Tax=Glarea lozoyensis (strain ATCC 20868 / MF5171) TaxID=1116229 RepID=S3DE23_GLAL2|nr:NAD(P)-binding Rossmann-fold containing protein [Glarea lozoyensis ATCC 20868]EPE35334.1 NAD(P)-binding Rossmann-fold containing protein [Glarea lozoyensis ATCC 20868]